MSSAPRLNASASNEVPAAPTRSEQRLVSDALQSLPPLSKLATGSLAGDPRGTTGDDASVLSSAPASPSHPASGGGGSYALGADDEELLLQELLNITAGATPFVASKAPPTLSSAAEDTRTGAARSTQSEPSGSPSADTTTPAAAAASAATASPPHSKQASPAQQRSSPSSRTSQRKQSKVQLTLKEEQDILDAILAAVDGQQSSISGDLAGATSSTAASPSPERAQAAEQQHEEDAEQDAVDRVLEEAKLLASSTVLCETQRGELVLHIHEHVALRRQLAELAKTTGTPTCVALAEPTRPPPPPPPAAANGSAGSTAAAHAASAAASNLSSSLPAGSTSAAAQARSLFVAIGTNLGAVVLFDQRWAVLGRCGSVEASVVSARGAVVSLSLSTLAVARDSGDEPTAATGHAKGTFILWSLHTFSPLRVLKDESTVPLLRVLHLHRDPNRVLVLESSGAVKLFQFWKVMSKHMLRSTTVTAASAATPVSDVDTLPLPSTFYLRNLSTIREYMPGAASAWNTESGLPWLCAPPPLPHATAASAGVSRTSWSTVAEKHLVAAVTNDALLLYVVEAGLQGSVAAVARHTHPPSSALSNELVRFVVLEQDGVPPRVLVCVSWNTEIELLMLTLVISGGDGSLGEKGSRGKKGEPVVQSLERIALLRLTAPLLQMVPLAASSMLLLDQNNDAQLMDASVAVMVERHHFGTLEYVTFASRLTGMKYNGTVAANQSTALLMGKTNAYSLSVYSWRERLATLVARRRFVEALDLAKGFAEEVALSTVGLSSNAVQRRRELHQYMERILLAYLESCLPGGPAAGADSEASLYNVLQHVAAYCSNVDGLDLLYGPLTRLLQQRGLLNHLLYVLERTLRNGIITYMPEPLIERFIHLFLSEAALAAVEVELGVRAESRADTGKHTGALSGRAASEVAATTITLPGKERAELALMCLDTGLANLLRVAQEQRLLRLSVTIMSYRQKQYREALAYALDEEEAVDAASPQSPAVHASSVAIDLVEYTLKDCALLPGADIPASEQSSAKHALLEFLLERTDGRGSYQLLRFLRRQPQHAVRVLLFALSDEGLCSPWCTDLGGFCRTQFVSSVFFIMTGGSRAQPRVTMSGMGSDSSSSSAAPLNLFFIGEEKAARMPTLRLLRAGELAQRPFPPYDAVHTLLAGAARFNELFLSDGEAAIRFDVWTDLVIQDALFVFQRAETAEERRSVQEQLIEFVTPPFIPRERVAVFQPDFTRLHMARCLAALLCKEKRYADAIQCYIDPTQNQMDATLQHDVFGMLRSEMQRLQDLRSHSARAARQMSASRRFDSDFFSDTTQPQSPAAEGTGGTTFEVSRRSSNASFTPAPSSVFTSASDVDAAIKALQRGVMTQVESLVRIDATALAQFIFDYLPSNHREVMRLLRGSSAAFLDYLDELMAQEDAAVANDMNLQNTYIELLCAHAPQRVFAHLRDKGSAITYDVQLALRAVRKYRIADASIYLLEKTMLIDEAVTVMVGATRAALAAVREEVLTACGSDEGGGSHATHNSADGTSASRREGAKPPVATASSATSANAPATAAAAVIALTGPNAVPSSVDLLRLIEIGKDLCRKYQAGGSGGGSGGVAAQRPEYWFRLLDVFMVPRRLLSEVLTQDERLCAADSGGAAGRKPDSDEDGTEGTGMESELEVAARFSAAALGIARGARDGRYSTAAVPDDAAYHLPALTRPLRPSQRRAITALMAVYTPCTSDVLRAMMNVLDLAVVMDKVVRDNKDEAFRPFKPIILDMMASLQFELEANRLCESATESDVMALGRELYQRLNTGIVTLSDCCALCHQHLSEPPLPPPLAATITTSSSSGGSAAVRHDTPAALGASPSASSAVCVYTCGHAFHTACCQHTVGASAQVGCCVCAEQRFTSAQNSGDAAAANSRRSSLAAASSNTAAKRQVTAAAAASSGVYARQPLAVDVARMQRRVRQTKMKLDHAEDLYPLLKSYLAWGDSAPSTPATAGGPGASTDLMAASSAADTAKRADKSNWVLAPSPRVPAAVGDLDAATTSVHNPSLGAGSGALDDKGLDVETLTDAEILELFGTL